MALAPVVVGVADHTGWAALVCVSVKGGSPEVIDRRRVELIEPGLPKHPYEHETVGMSAAEAERLVQEVRDSAVHCAGRALSRLRSGLGTTGEILSIALRTAPLPRLPGSVAEVHASWPVTMRADAMLYHDALCTSAASLGINVDTFARGEERPRAAEATATTAERLDRFLSGCRASLGPPWQQDHQAAAARAIAALGRYTTLQLDKPR
jgi:FAD/FMN-containing dehydrogenase